MEVPIQEIPGPPEAPTKVTAADLPAQLPPKDERLNFEARRSIIVAFYQTFDVPPSLRPLQDLIEQRFGEEMPITTLQRYLGSEGRVARGRRNVPRIERACFSVREDWARTMVHYPDFFSRLVFSDEKVFIIETSNRGSPVVYTRERNDPRRLRPTAGRNCVQFMVFGMLTADGHADLNIVPTGASGSTTAAVYGRNLTTFVTDFFATLPAPARVLLEDNASCHRRCKRYDVNFQRIKDGLYPAHSPDFNAIERVGPS